MSGDPNKFQQFWQELKRRKVVQVVLVYATATFVIIELVNNVYETLNLPAWTPALTLIILAIGFPLAIIFSWIFDVTPGGIEITKPLKEVEGAPPRLFAWKLATIISAVVIIGLVILNIVRSTERSRDIQTMEKSIAVLPFENWNYEVEYSHMGNAIANEIITELYKIREFRVFSHTSTLQYKGSKKPISEIGQELGVNYIIEGIIERQGSRVSIHVQVIRVKNEDHIWAEEYEGDWKDIFMIQDNIAFKVAKELKAVLSEDERESITKKPTDNLEAYNSYLRANDFFNRGFDEQDFSIAIKMYQKAIELDPDFALAYTMLAKAHLQIYWHHHDRSMDRLTESKKAIDAAFSIDPDLVEAYVALGSYYYMGFLDYSNAKKQFQSALERMPNNTECIYFIATVERRMGHWDEAIEGFDRAFRKEPSDAVYAYVAGQTYYLMNKYPEALRYFDMSINLNPDFKSSYKQKIRLFLKSEGNTINARKTLEEASLMINISSDPSFINIIVDLDIYDRDFQNAINLLNSSGFEAINSQFYYYPKTLLLAKIYDLSGDKEKADQYYDQSRNLIESRLKSYPDDSRYYSSLGICYAGLDQKEQAIKHAEKAVELLPVSKEAFRGMYRLGDLAQIYVMVGENEQALETLDMLLSIPGVLSANLLQLDPTWKPLWDHPEFIRLIEKFAQ